MTVQHANDVAAPGRARRAASGAAPRPARLSTSRRSGVRTLELRHAAFDSRDLTLETPEEVAGSVPARLRRPVLAEGQYSGVTPSSRASRIPTPKLALFVCPDSICRIAPSVIPTACARLLGVWFERVRSRLRRSLNGSVFGSGFLGMEKTWPEGTIESYETPGYARCAPNL